MNALAAALASVDPAGGFQNFGVFIPVSNSSGQNSGDEVYLFDDASSYSTTNDYSFPDSAGASAYDNLDFFSYTHSPKYSEFLSPRLGR
jgi:hypothetical protein